jgi:ketol-acid reductoisomerase
MKSLRPDPLQGSFTLADARVAVLGYDEDARTHALALSRAGNTVAIGVQPDTTCWARAAVDGFAVGRPSSVVSKTDVVVVLMHEAEQTWRQCEPYVAGGTLVVFGSARALQSGACACSGVDVVLVTTIGNEHAGCRVAVHRDVTGRALVRAVAYARAAFGAEVELRATCVHLEADIELASVGERAGSLLALYAQTERLPPRVRKPLALVDDDFDDEADTPGVLDPALAWWRHM